MCNEKMAAASANPPKQKRRNSEKRKEKSRDAARCRRSKESEIFSDLSEILPLPSGVAGHLDKASVMRLAIAYLRARNLFGNATTRDVDLKQEQVDDDVAGLDRLVPRFLQGFLVVLSKEGDIVYVTEDVSQHLGLPQVDLIGQSIYEYSHPCDHNEVKESLAAARANDGDDDVHLRSFFLRFKCTLTNKGRSVNLKSATYKVIHCTGRYVSRKKAGSDYLVLIGEPIPHPSNVEGPLDRDTFLTKHSLDMKYIYVDDKITQFLGYKPEELEGKSAFEFHHVLDNEPVSKHYKTMVAKGQSQTSAYRFLALHGGYVWLQTQSTVIYGSRDSRPQAVVCLHKVLSEIEEPELILSSVQSASAEKTRPVKKSCSPVAVIKETPTEKPVPKTSTSKMFAPRTADMDKGYLIVNEISGGNIFKEEPEDLTHLAPKAGDICIPLEMPFFSQLDDLYQDLNLTGSMLDCVPLTGLDFSASSAKEEPSAGISASGDQDPAVSVTASLFSKDPFFFVNKDDLCGSAEHSMSELFSPLAAKTPETYEEYIGGLPSPPKVELSFHEEKMDPMESFLNQGLDPASPTCARVPKTEQHFGVTVFPLTEQVPAENEEEDFKFRAPFIPMGDVDLPLFNCDEFLMDFNLGSLPPPATSSTLNEEPDSCAKRTPETTLPFAKSLLPTETKPTDSKLSATYKRSLTQSADDDDVTALPQKKRQRGGKPMAALLQSALNGGGRKRCVTGEKLSLDAGHVKTEPTAKKRHKEPPATSSSILKLLTAGQDSGSPLLSLLKRPASWKAEAQRTGKPEGSAAVIYPLLSLTSYDCEVNAPLQAATGLLQGEDLLKALDVPLNFGNSD